MTDKLSAANEAFNNIADVLAGVFKRGDGDLIELTLRDLKGSEAVYQNDKMRTFLTRVLKERHNLYLCIEASKENIFIMSEAYFDNMTKGSLQLNKEELDKGLNTFGSYESFMDYPNQQERNKH